MPRRQGHQGGSGRINPHDRNTDDVTPTVVGPGISAQHAAAIFTTAAQGLSKQVRTEHRSCIRCFIKFLFKQYPTINEECTILVSQELRADATNYYMEKDTGTLSNLTSTHIASFLFPFLSEMCINCNVKHYSVSNITKLHDAMKFGSTISKRLLSANITVKRAILDA